MLKDLAVEATVARLLALSPVPRSVALQLPDALLPASFALCAALSAGVVGTRFAVLADTSWGECCVDEVAAGHAEAEAVVHYGRACLSATTRLPVVYVFGRLAADNEAAQKTGQLLVGEMRDEDDGAGPVVVLGDTRWSHVLGAVAAELRAAGRAVAVAHPSTVQGGVVADEEAEEVAESDRDVWVARRRVALPRGAASLADCSLCYVGAESQTLAAVVMAHGASQAVYSCDPAGLAEGARLESRFVNRQLSRRYGLLETVREAAFVGIVVGTLGVDKYLEVIEGLRAIISAAGKHPTSCPSES